MQLQPVKLAYSEYEVAEEMSPFMVQKLKHNESKSRMG